MRVLVTGSCGYIGDVVIENLLQHGHYVCAVDSMLYTDSYMRPNIEFHRIDIRSAEFEILMFHQWDAIIHLAAIVGDGACQANPEETVDVNEAYIKYLVRLTPPDTKLIFASTCSVYGANNSLLDENSQTNPLSLYAGTKLNAEKYISKHPNHVIFRLGTLYGVSSSFGRIRTDLVANILAFKACDGQRLTVFGGQQWRPMLHVKDAGRIFAEAVTEDYTGTFILSHSNYTVMNIAKSVINIIQSNAGIDFTDMKFEDLRNYKVCNDKAKYHDIKPSRTLYEGIKEIEKIYKIEGRIKNPWLTQYNNAKFIKEQL